MHRSKFNIDCNLVSEKKNVSLESTFHLSYIMCSFYRSAHLYIPLNAIHFGSLMRARFLSHFSRYAEIGTLEEQQLCMTTLQTMRGSAEDIEYPMIVNFEHDRDLFVVRFAVLDG